jgi:hypothetical protein
MKREAFVLCIFFITQFACLLVLALKFRQAATLLFIVFIFASRGHPFALTISTGSDIVCCASFHPT